jgi:hypothetical protein
MKVIAEDPWNWFLFDDGGRLYLDVLVENGAASFSVAAELTRDQVDGYHRDGPGSLASVAGEMRHEALMRTWRIGALPSDWGERSVAAVHEWQRRAKACRGA